jgi:hypothetical protein
MFYLIIKYPDDQIVIQETEFNLQKKTVNRYSRNTLYYNLNYIYKQNKDSC